MIKQSVHTRMNLVGDGTSSTYSFDLGRVYGMNFDLGQNSSDAFSLINSDAIPDSISIIFVNGPTGLNATATVARRTVTFEFSEPFQGSALVAFGLEFNG